MYNTHTYARRTCNTLRTHVDIIMDILGQIDKILGSYFMYKFGINRGAFQRRAKGVTVGSDDPRELQTQQQLQRGKSPRPDQQPQLTTAPW